jgi:hypothetical protein
MANVKPGRAKDNARAKVDVPKRKSAKATAKRVPDNNRARESHTAASAEAVYAAMRALLERKERFTTAIRQQDANLADPAPAYREVAGVFSTQDLAVFVWTYRRAVLIDEQEQFDRAVRHAARRPNGLVALAGGLKTGKGDGRTLPWAKSRNRQRLAIYNAAVRWVKAYLRAPEGFGPSVKAAMMLEYLAAIWERPWLHDVHQDVREHRPARDGAGYPFTATREKLRKAREKKHGKTEGVGRARLIIDEVVGIDPEDVKTVQRRSK